jgi:hypothetical protein
MPPNAVIFSCPHYPLCNTYSIGDLVEADDRGRHHYKGNDLDEYKLATLPEGD